MQACADASALALLRRDERAVLLSDVRLPGLSGLELMEQALNLDGNCR